MRNLIRENKVPQIHSMMQLGSEYGMQTMQDQIAGLVADGVVSPEEGERLLLMAASSHEERAGGKVKKASATAASTRRTAESVRTEYSF